jgi:hypothetical protein
VIFQGFARRIIFLSVSSRLRRRLGSAITAEPADDPRQQLDRAERTLGRPRAVYQILWVRGFIDPTISGRGFNLFKPLRRHFRATPFCRQVYNAGIVSVPNARRAFLVGAAIPACGKGSRKIEIPSAFCGFSRLCKAENFPVGRHVDFLFRAIGAAPTATTMPPTMPRPGAPSPRHVRASARRRPGLVAAI